MLRCPPELSLLALLLAGCTVSSQASSAPVPVASTKVTEAVTAPVLEALREAQELELVSLFPYTREADEEVWEERDYEKLANLDGYPVLGNTVLADDARAITLTAFFTGIDESTGLVAECFSPRHALRAEHAGHRYEIVICYECLSMHILADGEMIARPTTTEGPRGAFNAVLSAANVPLSDE